MCVCVRCAAQGPSNPDWICTALTRDITCIAAHTTRHPRPPPAPAGCCPRVSACLALDHHTASTSASLETQTHSRPSRPAHPGGTCLLHHCYTITAAALRAHFTRYPSTPSAQQARAQAQAPAPTRTRPAPAPCPPCTSRDRILSTTNSIKHWYLPHLFPDSDSPSALKPALLLLHTPHWPCFAFDEPPATQSHPAQQNSKRSHSHVRRWHWHTKSRWSPQFPAARACACPSAVS